MTERRSANIYPFPPPPRRGRPRGSVKSREQKVKDRVRTVAALNNLFRRICCVHNVAQFARWFDENMRIRYPGRIWDTNGSNKWRKNMYGTAAMTEEWLGYLQELFPDKRYYGACESSSSWWETKARYSENEAANGSQNAKDLFHNGPECLWKAIWQSCNNPDELWDIYAPRDTTWGVGNYEAALDDLEMKLYSNFDCDKEITYEDLGRAVVLYRIQYGVEPHFINSFPPEWGIRAYLCLKVALGGNCPDSLGVMPDIANYFADLELDRLRECSEYVRALHEKWQDRGISTPPCIYEYAINPFLLLCNAEQHTLLKQRYAKLASLTVMSFQRF